MEKCYSKIRKITKKGKSDVYDFTVDDTHRILANNFYTSNCSVNHPNIESFIDAKMEAGKVTGANISVKIDDEFMRAVKNNGEYIQKYPIYSESPDITNVVDAKKLWNKIIHNAWDSAEPGVLFWDTIIRESVSDCYSDLGFGTVSTNPCAEIPLCPYDSCRLLCLNLYSYVENPFTKNSYFNFELFEKHVKIAQRFMDDIVDLEIEKIDMILQKIESDPEEEYIRVVERELWQKIKDKTIEGRRTGLGITAEGDMLAALNLTYGTKKSTEFSVQVHKSLAINAYKSSCILAEERGSFEIYDYNREINNPFINRLRENDKELDSMLKKGRRNISILTTAPTGTVSIMTQTSSGIEPAFLVFYKRRKKININDKNSTSNFVDELGDHWEEFNVFHHKFIIWLEVNGYNVEDVKNMKHEDVQKIVEKSPYYKATSNDVDWIEKVKLQGEIQKFIDHSISVTINLPNNVTEELVSKVYETGWSSGCKGMTVYRDGSRSGVLVAADKKEDKKEEEKIYTDTTAPKRPKSLNCDVVRFVNNKEKWIGFVGLFKNGDNENRPYEIFTGLLDSFQVPQYVDNGEIVKNKIDGVSRYDFVYKDKDGYPITMTGLNRAFQREHWNYGRMISGVLRHRMPIKNVVELIDSLKFEEDNIVTWKAGVKRMLKKYTKSELTGDKCPNCGSDNYVHEGGCDICKDCGFSKHCS